MIDEPLPVCPQCEYALTGLPPPHRCPECGFEYDERSRAWYAPVRSHYLIEYIGPVVAVGLIGLGLGPIFVNGISRPAHLIFVALLMLAVAGIVRGGSRKLASRRRLSCVAIAPRGLYIRSDIGEKWIPWQDVGRAVFSGEFSYMTYRGSDQTANIPGVFTDQEAQAVFSELVQLARKHYLEIAIPPDSRASQPS
ncbi:MAG: hypothetical protein KF841_04955 [Phycisphaerae bacterium]|nr:hypothetical protein [Phycisphaerae bacterium]